MGALHTGQVTPPGLFFFPSSITQALKWSRQKLCWPQLAVAGSTQVSSQMLQRKAWETAEAVAAAAAVAVAVAAVGEGVGVGRGAAGEVSKGAPEEGAAGGA